MPSNTHITIALIVVGVGTLAVLIFTGLWEEWIKKILIVIGILAAINLLGFLGIWLFVILGIIMLILGIPLFISYLKEGPSQKKSEDDSEDYYDEESSEDGEQKKKHYNWIYGHRKATGYDFAEKRACLYCKNQYTYLCPKQDGDDSWDDTCSNYEGF